MIHFPANDNRLNEDGELKEYPCYYIRSVGSGLGVFYRESNTIHNDVYLGRFDTLEQAINRAKTYQEGLKK